MTNKLNLPASYAVMNEEEMTYTQGGSALGAAATVVGAVVLGSSYLWGISQAKDWLSVKKNREGNFLTVAGAPPTPSPLIWQNPPPTSCATVFPPPWSWPLPP